MIQNIKRIEKGLLRIKCRLNKFGVCRELKVIILSLIWRQGKMIKLYGGRIQDFLEVRLLENFGC